MTERTTHATMELHMILSCLWVCVCVAFPFTFGWMNGISNPINITHLLKLCQVFHKKISYGRMSSCIMDVFVNTICARIHPAALHKLMLACALVCDVHIESRASHHWIPKFWVCVCKVYDCRRYILNANNLFLILLLFLFPESDGFDIDNTVYSYLYICISTLRHIINPFKWNSVYDLCVFT